MTTPTVSVVVLTLNSERYIRRCLQSLARQSLSDFEAIVVDAGSTDSTREIVKTFDQRFRWLELPGSDMGAARNHGMRMSRGRYLMFLDSDDFYLSTKLQRQVETLATAPAVDVAFCLAWHFRTGRPEKVGIKRSNAHPVKLEDFMAGQCHNVNTICLRRKVWEAGIAFGEGNRGRYGEEWRLQLAMALLRVPMISNVEPLAVVELRPDSHTRWSIQWTMKKELVSELEQVAGRLTPAERSVIDVQSIIDNFRFKLVIALLLDSQAAEAERAASLIRAPQWARRATYLLQIARHTPSALLSGVLRRIWLLRQDRSFAWQPLPPVLRKEFADLQVSSVP